MKSAIACTCLGLGALTLSACFGPSTMDDSPGVMLSDNTSTFAAHHSFSVEVPQGTKHLQVWFAMPNENDNSQDVSDWEVNAPYSTSIVYDTRGNNFLYLEATNPTPGSFDVHTNFTVTRAEISSDLNPANTRPHTQEELNELSQYLGSESETIVDDNARRLAKEIIGNEKNPIIAARKLYDWELDYVEYHVKDPKPDAQKMMNSTGTGSSIKTYQNQCGNCTDFHSLYMAIARAAGIPTRAVYGSFFKGPLNGVDKDQSYHCWVEFHAPDIGWIPLDVAVADVFTSDFKANEHSRPRAALTTADGYNGADAHLVDYYFGNLEDRRVSWHLGRDLIMNPPQAGKPLLWNPKAYGEADGKSIKVSRKLTYKEVK